MSIPTYEQARLAVANKSDSAMDRFVYEFSPESDDATPYFSKCLQALIAHLLAEHEKEIRQ